MFPYKFASHAQKNDTSQVGAAFSNPLKRSNFDVIQNANFAENTPKMEFDGAFSQSLSSRRVESHALRSSSYLHHTPEIEIIDTKPSTSAIVSLFISLFSVRF